MDNIGYNGDVDLQNVLDRARKGRIGRSEWYKTSVRLSEQDELTLLALAECLKVKHTPLLDEVVSASIRRIYRSLKPDERRAVEEIYARLENERLEQKGIDHG